MNSRIDELIALAALGELTTDESAELDAAVAADPAIARELAEALDERGAVAVVAGRTTSCAQGIGAGSDCEPAAERGVRRRNLVGAVTPSRPLRPRSRRSRPLATGGAGSRRCWLRRRC